MRERDDRTDACAAAPHVNLLPVLSRDGEDGEVRIERVCSSRHFHPLAAGCIHIHMHSADADRLLLSFTGSHNKLATAAHSLKPSIAAFKCCTCVLDEVFALMMKGSVGQEALRITNVRVMSVGRAEDKIVMSMRSNQMTNMTWKTMCLVN